MRACRFSSVMSGSRPSKCGGEHLARRPPSRARSGGRCSARRGWRRAPARRPACPRRSSATASTTRGDAVGAERVGGDQRDERRVDPAREPEHDVPEAVLAHVVAQAQAERLVDLGDGLEQRRDRRRRAPARRVGAPLEARRRAAPGQRAPHGRAQPRVAQPRRRGGLEVDRGRASAPPRTAARARAPSPRGRARSSGRRRRARPGRRRGCRTRRRRGCRAPAGSASARARRPLPAWYGEADALTSSVAPASASSARDGPALQMSSQIVSPIRALPRSSTAASSPAWK